MKAALRYYHVRMQLVLDHIDRHPDDNLDLDVLSGIAAFSKYHFRRLFTATFGLPVHRYVQLVQMKRASYRLAYRDAASVTDIAMDAGYEAPDGLNQLYRERNGTSPNDRILSAYQNQQKSIEASAAYEGFKTAFAEHKARSLS